MKHGEIANMWFVWVYLFFCAQKIESFGRNTQEGVGFRQKSGSAVWIREAMLTVGGCRVLRHVSWASGSAKGLT